ncbi:hypothetical protein NN561_015900 [Cricetulus griseus]
MGRRMEPQTSRKLGSRGSAPISRPPAGWGHAPFVKPRLGDPRAPQRRAPARCLPLPGSCLRLRTTRGQRREETQSARPGHLFPRAGAALPLFSLPEPATHPAPQRPAPRGGSQSQALLASGRSQQHLLPVLFLRWARGSSRLRAPAPPRAPRTHPLARTERAPHL